MMLYYDTVISVDFTTMDFWCQYLQVLGKDIMMHTSSGFVLVVAPCVVICMSKMHTKIQNKHFILFGILMLALIGYNNGIILGSEWICSMTKEFVQYERELVAYPILLLMSISFLMIHMDFTDFLNEYEKELEEYFDPDDEHYFDI